MGYESKFYAVRDYGFGANYSKNRKNRCEIVASLDISKMGYNETVSKFLDCFDTESPVELYLPDKKYEEKSNEYVADYVDEDCYGDKLKYASDKENLYNCAKEVLKTDKNWPGFKMLVDFIKMLKDYDDIMIIHFGY